MGLQSSDPRFKSYLVIGKAFAEMQTKGDRASAAELHCIRAAVMPEHAETDLAAALTIAREQGARLPELRCATRLTRFWAENGRRGEVRDLLAPIYGSFTEGCDAADLREAKSLLKEFS